LVVRIRPNFRTDGYSDADFKLKYNKDARLDCQMQPEPVEVREKAIEQLFKVKSGDGLGYHIDTFFEKRVACKRCCDSGTIRIPSLLQFQEQAARRMMSLFTEYTRGKVEAEILKVEAARPAGAAGSSDDHKNAEEEYGDVEEVVGASTEQAMKYQKVNDGRLAKQRDTSVDEQDQTCAKMKKYQECVGKCETLAAKLNYFRDKDVCSIFKFNGNIRELKTCKRDFAAIGDTVNATLASDVLGELTAGANILNLMRTYGFPDKVNSKLEDAFFDAMKEALTMETYIKPNLPAEQVVHYHGLWGKRLARQDDWAQACATVSASRLIMIIGEPVQAEDSHTRLMAAILDQLYQDVAKQDEDPQLSRDIKINRKAHAIANKLCLMIQSGLIVNENAKMVSHLKCYLENQLPVCAANVANQPMTMADFCKEVEETIPHSFLDVHRNSDLFNALKVRASTFSTVRDSRAGKEEALTVIKAFLVKFEPSNNVLMKEAMVDPLKNIMGIVNDLPSKLKVIYGYQYSEAESDDRSADVELANGSLRNIWCFFSRLSRHATEALYLHLFNQTKKGIHNSTVEEQCKNLLSGFASLDAMQEDLRVSREVSAIAEDISIPDALLSDPRVQVSIASIHCHMKLQQLFVNVLPDDAVDVKFKEIGHSALHDASQGLVQDSPLRDLITGTVNAWQELGGAETLRTIWSEAGVAAIAAGVSLFFAPLTAHQDYVREAFGLSLIENHTTYKQANQPDEFLPILEGGLAKYKAMAQHKRDKSHETACTSLLSLGGSDSVAKIRFDGAVSDWKVLTAASKFTFLDCAAKTADISEMEKRSKIMIVALESVGKSYEKALSIVTERLSETDETMCKTYKRGLEWVDANVAWPLIKLELEKYTEALEDSAKTLIPENYLDVLRTENHDKCLQKLMIKDKAKKIQELAVASRAFKKAVSVLLGKVREASANYFTPNDQQERDLKIQRFETLLEPLRKFQDVQQALNHICIKWKSAQQPRTPEAKKKELDAPMAPQTDGAIILLAAQVTQDINHLGSVPKRFEIEWPLCSYIYIL
jgi:hypothetical protein